MADRVVRSLSSWVRSCCIVTCLAVTVAFCVLGWSVPGCERQRPQGSAQANSLPPEPDEQADNTLCLDCHTNFATEEISAKHFKKGFGCVACHGDSVAHGDDEGNVTKPDVLFGRTEIAPFCKMCHPTHVANEDYDKFVRKWRGRRRPSGVMLLDDATCMDCHGLHVRIGE